MGDQAITLRRRIDGHVLRITIDRPGRRNAFDASTSRAMAAALDEYDGDIELVWHGR